MSEHDFEQNLKLAFVIDFREGCPLCDHSDPALEIELQAWAQLVYDHFSSMQRDAGTRGVAPGIDSGNQSPTLKERSTEQSIQKG